MLSVINSLACCLAVLRLRGKADCPASQQTTRSNQTLKGEVNYSVVGIVLHGATPHGAFANWVGLLKIPSVDQHCWNKSLSANISEENGGCGNWHCTRVVTRHKGQKEGIRAMGCKIFIYCFHELVILFFKYIALFWTQ